jgi:hypothetical protein
VLKCLPANVIAIQVKLMCDYCTKHNVTEVPDPYYGGPAGFEKVWSSHVISYGALVFYIATYHWFGSWIQEEIKVIIILVDFRL